MAEYIERERLIHHLENCINVVKNTYGFPDDFETCLKAVQNQPTADVAEVKHGKWVDRYGEKHNNHLYECSECGEKALYDVKADELGSQKIKQVLSVICPHCGAKMDGEPQKEVKSKDYEYLMYSDNWFYSSDVY